MKRHVALIVMVVLVSLFTVASTALAENGGIVLTSTSTTRR